MHFDQKKYCLHILFAMLFYSDSKFCLILFCYIIRPYSPDMNPIELSFGEGKTWLKRHQDVCELNPQRCFEMALDQVF